jgi:pimeloyl-ACP methyl ester carboxylesterase
LGRQYEVWGFITNFDLQKFTKQYWFLRSIIVFVNELIISALFYSWVAVCLEKNLNIDNYKCPALYNVATGFPIVFLHGLSYSYDIWQRIGITEILIEKHISFLTLDMPYGMRSQCQPKTRNPEKNIIFTNKATQTFFDSQIPLLVGASIGGHMAIKYATRFPVKGLMLIAPARTLDPDLVAYYSQLKFPTTIIWGSEDNIVSGEDMRTLVDKLPNAKLIVYEGAKHSAYKDQPDRFRHDLLELYLKAEKT